MGTDQQAERTAVKRIYEEIEPFCKWQREKAQDTLELHLQGFRKEQLKVVISNFGNIIVSGERPLDQARWRRFNKRVELGNNYKEDEIKAKLSKDILYVILPKKIEPATSADTGKEAPTDNTSSMQGENSSRKKLSNLRPKMLNKKMVLIMVAGVFIAVAAGAFVKKYCHCIVPMLRTSN